MPTHEPPTTKYAVVFHADQTIIYEREDRSTTTKYPEVHLFEKLEDAVRRVAHAAAEIAIHQRTSEHFEKRSDAEIAEGVRTIVWVEVVTNEAEFRAREDTWCFDEGDDDDESPP